MASSKSTSGEKASRATAARRIQNRATRSAVKTHMTKAVKLVSSGEVEAAKGAVKQAVSMLDRAARKKVIHPNNAARRKSRLMRKLSQTSKS